MLDEGHFREWQDMLSPLPWSPTNDLALEIETVVQSALFAKHSLRWPLLLDPHGVALKWVCAAENQLTTLHGSLQHSKMWAAVETAAPMGTSVLIKDMCENDLANAQTLTGLLPRRINSMESSEYPSVQNTKIFVGLNAVKGVACHEDFRFYMTSQQQECSVAKVLWNGREQLIVIDFAHSHAALKSEMLQVIISDKQTAMYKEGRSLVQQNRRNRERILEVESEILKVLTETSKGSSSVLDNGLAIEKSQSLVAEVCNLREQQLDINRTKCDLYLSHKRYMPTAQAAQVFFCAISDLIHVEGAYAFSLRWFVDRILISSLKDIPSNDFKVDESNSAKNMDGIVAPLTHTLYRHISRTLLSKDRLLFALLLAVRPLLDKGAIGSAEWQFLLTGTACLQRAEGLVASALKSDATASPPDIFPAPQRVEEHENPAKSWLPDSQWTEMCSLSTLPAFSGLIEEFEAQIKMWKRIHDSQEPYTQPLPRHWDADLRGVNRLCILRCLRPDQIANAVRAFIHTQLGEDFLVAPKVDIDEIMAESKPLVPIVITTTQENKASAVSFVVGAANRMGRNVSHILVVASRTGVARRTLTQGLSSSSWVIIQNLQLCPGFTTHLEEVFFNNGGPVSAHVNFRAWCVMDVNHILTTNLLKAATKFVYEPPRGVRSVVLDLYNAALETNPDFLSNCTRGNEFRRLFFSLCICHAILRERVSYAS